MKDISQLEKGQEQYDFFEARGSRYCKYDYRHTNNFLFCATQFTLERCRELRDKWIKETDERDKAIEEIKQLAK